ncbi:hypothetical protein GW17_00031914 [Ensete ventricosum]|nr:hypothetical protein GW17_00031914 [Ensete ventricosum]RZS22317.1 hypothetical protein BHM03_00055069 [Ensete ventricosum]
MARPPAVATGHGQAPCSGNRLRPRPPAGGSRLQRDAHKGDDLQRGAHRQRQPPVGTMPVGELINQVATRGDAASPHGLPLYGSSTRPWAEAIAGDAQHYRMHMGSDGGAVRVKEGQGIFLRKR